MHITGGFWGERQAVNATASLEHCLSWMGRVGWIENFAAATGRRVVRDRRGREFSDSDVYKLLEAMAWEVARSGEATIASAIEEVTKVIEPAQEADGYLNTAFGHPGQPARYVDLERGHELYGYGHLIQAGVAMARSGVDSALIVVASVMLSWRLLLATGEARFADLAERTLYNVVATSPAADGRSFFYANTLHRRRRGAVPATDDDEPARDVDHAGALVRGVLLPAQRGPDVRQPGRVPGHRRRCRPPAPSLRRRRGRHGPRRRAAGRVRGAHRIPERRRGDRPDHPHFRPAWTLSLRIPGWAGHRTDLGADLIEPDGTRRRVGPGVAERGPLVLCVGYTDLPGDRDVDAVRVDASTAPGRSRHASR